MLVICAVYKAGNRSAAGMADGASYVAVSLGSLFFSVGTWFFRTLDLSRHGQYLTPV